MEEQMTVVRSISSIRGAEGGGETGFPGQAMIRGPRWPTTLTYFRIAFAIRSSGSSMQLSPCSVMNAL